MTPFYRRYSFRIGCYFFCAFAIIVIELLWVPHLREKRAETRIRNLGGITKWAYYGPAWVPTSVQAHLPMVWSVIHVRYGDEPVSDAQIECLDAFPRLSVLKLNSDDVTDAGLVQLKQLRRLTLLELSNARTTLEGRARLRKELPGCAIVPAP